MPLSSTVLQPGLADKVMQPSSLADEVLTRAGVPTGISGIVDAIKRMARGPAQPLGELGPIEQVLQANLGPRAATPEELAMAANASESVMLPEYMKDPRFAEVMGQYQRMRQARDIADPGNWLGAGVTNVVKNRGVAMLRKAARSARGSQAVQNLDLRNMDPEEALTLARAGLHLREQPGGGYYGGPRNITNAKKLGANRLRMDRELEAAAKEIENAMGQSAVGDWYPSQRRGVRSVTEYPEQATRMAQAEGLFSPQATPEGELGFSITAHNRYAREEPIGVVRTGAQARAYEKAQKTGTNIRLGQKTSIYAEHSNPNVPPRHTGTNDFRQAQYMGYTDPTGAPQTAGMTSAQHSFMDAETMLLADRANRKALGGRTDWTAPMVQEVPWIIEKANALQKQRPKSFPNTPAGRVAAIQEASKTVEDYIPKHTAGATYEYTPGAATGHVPGAPENYGERGAWMRPAGKKDVIYSGMRMLQQPGASGTGVYVNSLGKLETNPVHLAQPLVEFNPSRASGVTIDTKTAEMLNLGETFRGAIDAQEAAAWHLPIATSTRKAGTKIHAVLRMSGLPTSEQTKAIRAALPEGWDISATPQGLMLMNFGEATGRDLAKQISDIRKVVEPMTGGRLERAGMESNYIPIFARPSGHGTSATPAGQGLVTQQVLEQAAKIPGAARNLSESEGVRAAIRAKIARDQELASKGIPVREDIQAMRKFFSEADWAKAVEMIKNGIPPAAALAALGYSLSGMASEGASR